MSRSINNTNKAVFDKLRTHIQSSGRAHQALDLKEDRWIAGTDDERQALERVKLIHISDAFGLGPLALLKWNDRAFAAFPIANISHFAPETLEATPVSNAGISLVLYAQPHFRVIAPPADVLDMFGARGQHYLEDISAAFQPISTFEFTERMSNKKPAELWSTAQSTLALLHLSNDCPIWLKDARDELNDACRGKAGRYTGESLLAAAVSDTPHLAYLHIFRALESLFRVAAIEAFLQRINHNSSAGRPDIQQAMTNELSWRIRNDFALTRLIQRLSEHHRESVASLLGVTSSPEAIQKTLSETRNGIAHGSIFGRMPAVKPSLIQACALLLNLAYEAVAIPDSWIPEQI